MRIEEVIGSRIREAREASTMTQEEFGSELAKYLGKPWPRQAVSAAEKGQRGFTAVELLAFSMALRVSVDDLFRPPADAFELTFPSGITVAYDASSHPSTTPDAQELRSTLIDFIRVNQELHKRSGETDRMARWLYDDLDRLLGQIAEMQTRGADGGNGAR